MLPSPIFMILAQKMWPQLKKVYDESRMPLPLFPNSFMLYWMVNIENRAILTPLPSILDCIFGLYFWRGRRPSQKYNPKIQFNIEKYCTRRSRVRYFAISNEEIIPSEISHTSRGPVKAACGPGPRDVWDISRGMISEFDIAR